MRTGAILAVVGVSFHQDVVRTVQVGDHVTLVHEPDNPYDANAFAVKNAEGAVLGHIPATLAPRFTNPASGGTRGARWAGTVADLTHHEDNVGLRVRLDTELPPLPGDAGTIVAGDRG